MALNNSCVIINKNYTEIYKQNLVLGFKIGEAVICSEVFMDPPPIHEQPFMNRLKEIGGYNYLQDAFISHIKPGYIYQGLLQGAKWFPNFLFQNHIKGLIEHFGYKPGPFIKNLMVVIPGMTLFFTIGAAETKIAGEGYKWGFVTGILTTVACICANNIKSEKLENSQAIKLSLISAGWAGLGLIGSFVVNEVSHRIEFDEGKIFGLDKIDLLKLSIVGGTTFLFGGSAVALIASSVVAALLVDPIVEYMQLDKGDFYGYNKVDLLSMSVLSISAAGTLTPEKSSAAGGKIVAFSIAKANGVTAVEWVHDHAKNIKDYVCSFPIIETGCEYLGLVNQTPEEQMLCSPG